jgi:hypothetical protein
VYAKEIKEIKEKREIKEKIPNFKFAPSKRINNIF